MLLVSVRWTLPRSIFQAAVMFFLCASVLILVTLLQSTRLLPFSVFPNLSTKTAVTHTQQEIIPPVLCMTEHANPVYCHAIEQSASSFEEGARSCTPRKDASLLFEEIRVADVFVNGSRMAGQLPYDQYESSHVDRNAQSYMTYTCTSPSRWTLTTIGPFITTGGEYWVEFLLRFKDSRALEEYIPSYQRGMYAFTGFFLGSVDERYGIISHPPIHNHHFHLFGDASVAHRGHAWDVTLPYPTKKEWWPTDTISTHSENVCSSEEGGVNCMVRVAPPGMAYIANEPLAGWNAFNDVRPSLTTPLKLWSVLAVQTANPASVEGRQPEAIRLYFAGVSDMPNVGSRGTYTIPTRTDCVIWMTGTFILPAGRKLVEAYFHTHDVKDMWYFSGSPVNVFSNMRTAPVPNQLHCQCGIVKKLMHEIWLRQRQPNATRLVCSYKSNSPVESIQVGGGWRKFTRKGRCAIDFDKPKWTVVVFHQRKLESAARETMRMHATMRIFYSTLMNSSFSPTMVALGETLMLFRQSRWAHQEVPK